jgi:phosphoribosylglycinamide formyltransferase-1
MRSRWSPATIPKRPASTWRRPKAFQSFGFRRHPERTRASFLLRFKKSWRIIASTWWLMRIVPDDFLARWEGRIVNIHPSLLPRHKGLGTHDACLAAGETVTGATVHLVTPDLDSGEILGKVEVAVLPNDTPESLAERVLIAEHQLYPRIVSQYLGRARDFDWITGRVGELALAMPATHFQTSHGSPGWKVGTPSNSKFFAIMWNRHHGEESIGVLVKCSGQDEMAQLIDADPEMYFRPAYYGPSDWVGITLDRPSVDWDHIADRLAQSWELVAPRRLLEAGGR